jgi:hypothetical protein
LRVGSLSLCVGLITRCSLSSSLIEIAKSDFSC